MSHWITLVTPHGRMNGWLAEPDDKPNGGVVIAHDVYGINSQLQMIAARYAEAGYLTLIPALFDMIQREVELSPTPENFRIGTSVAEKLGPEIATELLGTAVDSIAHAGKIAVTGYGWGTAIARRASQEYSLPLINDAATTSIDEGLRFLQKSIRHENH